MNTPPAPAGNIGGEGAPSATDVADGGRSEDSTLMVGDGAIALRSGECVPSGGGTGLSAIAIPEAPTALSVDGEMGPDSRLWPHVLRSILSSRASCVFAPKKPFVPRLPRCGCPCCDSVDAAPEEGCLEMGGDPGGETAGKPSSSPPPPPPRRESEVSETLSAGTGGGRRGLVTEDARDDRVSSILILEEVLELLAAVDPTSGPPEDCESESRNAASSGTRLQSIRFRFGSDGDVAADPIPACHLYCSNTASTSYAVNRPVCRWILRTETAESASGRGAICA